MPARTDSEWTLRLFFSVDLIDSTQYKATCYSERKLDWTLPFEDFYSAFPDDFAGLFSLLVMEKYPDEALQDDEIPSAWKFMGDEILLKATVRNSKLIPVYLEAFRRALRKKCLDADPFGCKGCVWSAGFPVLNRIVEPGGRILDFIGPSLDCGFRLTKYASARKLTVSVEVALMAARHLLMANLPSLKTGDDKELAFFFDGRESLKGVLNNRPYPIFWLDTTPYGKRKDEYPEDILEKRHAVELKELHDYCLRFIANNTPHIIIPFVHNDRCREFSTVPEELEEQRAQILSFEETKDGMDGSSLKSLDPVESHQTENATKDVNIAELLSSNAPDPTAPVDGWLWQLTNLFGYPSKAEPADSLLLQDDDDHPEGTPPEKSDRNPDDHPEITG